MFFKTWLCIQVKAYEEGVDILSYLIERKYLCPLHWGLFKPLEKQVRFEKLKEQNELLRSQLQEKSEYKYEVFLPEGYTKVKKYPVFFTLHGDGKNIEHHKMFWKPDWLLSEGYIVVYLQSSQVSIYEGYLWMGKRMYLFKMLRK
ncbi:hypothetical protein [Oceanirhabdus seepicola]|uniref:Uncharacterized protein n=1 Tax=Oceanirhabdus seepicola TaxID=2828781 RepID=A0A9J6P077_9CLOT|nr:hypothetical protein [Oceanirhabdus seepicola]MCM1989939.1 hypothetical protein [Oceanirhabdus seepicola]